MDVRQFRKLILKPTLERIGLYSPEAEKLLLMTAVHESGGLRYVRQLSGPALGFFQMEPATFTDLRDQLQPMHTDKFLLLQGHKPPLMCWEEALQSVLPLQIVACRLQYWRFPEPLPDLYDETGIFRYYKKYWNTAAGAANEADFLNNWKNHGVDENGNYF